MTTTSVRERLLKISHLRLLVALALFCYVNVQETQAVSIHFDELGSSSGGTRMPSPYHGLRWDFSDWHFMTLVTAPTQSFLALSSSSTLVTSASGEDFYFGGADFWSRRGLDANGRFYFFLYRDGVTVYNGVEEDAGRQLFNETHQLLTPNYAGPIDAFALSFDSGGDDWDHLAMDNLLITPVPEPGGIVALSLALLVGIGRRTRGSTLIDCQRIAAVVADDGSSGLSEPRENLC